MGLKDASRHGRLVNSDQHNLSVFEIRLLDHRRFQEIRIAVDSCTPRDSSKTHLHLVAMISGDASAKCE